MRGTEREKEDEDLVQFEGKCDRVRSKLHSTGTCVYLWECVYQFGKNVRKLNRRQRNIRLFTQDQYRNQIYSYLAH